MRKHRPNQRSLRGGFLPSWAILAAGLLVGGGWSCGSGVVDMPWPADAVTADFQDLHSRVYQVYALGPDRNALHALLSESFEGRALTREYVEHFTTLMRMQREETSIEVRKVDYGEVRILRWTDASVVVDADWSVGGIVTHQGHKHSRVNRYRALYTLAPGVDGELRIVATAMRDLRRLRNPLAIDGFFGGGDGGSGGSAFMDPMDFFDAGMFINSEPGPDGRTPDDDGPEATAGNKPDDDGDNEDPTDDEFLDLENFWE